jgi:hypothetical protein
MLSQNCGRGKGVGSVNPLNPLSTYSPAHVHQNLVSLHKFLHLLKLDSGFQSGADLSSITNK